MRRDSRHRGEREERIWRALGATKADANRFKWAMLRAARFHERQTREATKHNGALGGIGLEVLEFLLELGVSNWKTGRVEPAIVYICERIRRSRTAVVKALARLKACGFLDWIRRSEPTDNVGEAGPQVRQIENAYGFNLGWLGEKTPTAAKWIRAILGKPRSSSADDGVAEWPSLPFSCEDQVRLSFAGAGPLGEDLARLGRALDGSASHSHGQTEGREG